MVSLPSLASVHVQWLPSLASVHVQWCSSASLGGCCLVSKMESLLRVSCSLCGCDRCIMNDRVAEKVSGSSVERTRAGHLRCCSVGS